MRRARFDGTRVLAAVVVSAWLATLNGAAVPSPQSSDALTIPTGEALFLQLETPLHTRTTKQGERAVFTTVREIWSGTRVAIPRGSSVTASVTKVKRPGRLAGRAEIILSFKDIQLPGGTQMPLDASIVRAGLTGIGDAKGEPKIQGEKGSGGDLAAVVNGGVQGAVIGVLGGGAKGAAYGGAIGAGIGLAGVLLKRGPDIDLPRNTLFEAKFDRPLQISAAVADRAAIAAASIPSSTRGGGPPDLRVPSRNGRRAPDLGGSAPDVTGGAPDVTSGADPTSEQPPVYDSSAPEPAPRVVTKPTLSRSRPSEPTAPAAQPQVQGGADAADPGAFKVSVDVKLVEVDALVRDRSGRFMETLKREDFRLYENSVEQTILSFSRDEHPLAVALVVDRSGSVAPFMNELRNAAYRALRQLKPGDEVALFSFAGEVERLEELTTDRQRVADRIATIHAGGGTNIVDALFDAVYYLGMVAPDRRRAVILFSDNQATTRPRASEGQVIRMALETETVVYSIKTAGEAIPLTMRIPTWLGGSGSVSKITEETGGEIIDVLRSGSIDSAMAAVIARLKLSYTLGYYPSDGVVADGKFRKIDVRLSESHGLAGQDYSVSARRGYYSGTDRSAARQTR